LLCCAGQGFAHSVQLLDPFYDPRGAWSLKGVTYSTVGFESSALMVNSA